MSLLGNIVWFVFGGLWSFLGYSLGALLMCLTLVGIPFGVQAFKLGVASLAPFGKEIIEGPHSNSPLRLVFNVIWLVLCGWEIALAHLSLALLLALTVVGLPFAYQHLKLVPLCLLPFGKALR